MGEMNFLQHLDAVIPADPDTRRSPLADPVHRQDQRLVKRRGKKCAGRVAPVMLGEEQLVLPVEAGGPRLEPLAEQILLKQFLLEPQRQRHAERAEPARRKGEIGLEQPLELYKRLLVENDVVEIIEIKASFVETVANGVFRVARILLLAGKRSSCAAATTWPSSTSAAALS
jgi:hypothetical protein